VARKPPIGSVVAGSRLISVLGEGATGVVYLAEKEGAPEHVVPIVGFRRGGASRDFSTSGLLPPGSPA
jgi:hypothetical protein